MPLISLNYRKSFLIDYLRAHPNGIATVRVSSAKAKGAAKLYSYWGAAMYRVRLGADSQPVNVCTRRATSDRRTVAGAMADAKATGRILLARLGTLTDSDVDSLVSALVARNPYLAS